MNILIMGAGGVGGYYGALLARSGQDVAFIARGKHLRAIQQGGLRIKSVHGDFQIHPARAVENPADIGPVDFVLVAVKTYDLDAAAAALRPAVGPETTIMPLLNGVDAAERLGDVAGADRVLAGATWISAAVEEPGVIGQYSSFRRVVAGEMDGRETPRLRKIVEAFRAAGAEAEASSDIRKVIWTKYSFIAASSAIGTLTRVPVGEYRGVPETRAILGAAIGEIAAVGRARGVVLDPDIVERTLAFIDASAPGITPSMQKAVEAGRRSEMDALIGAALRMGRAAGLAVPVLETAYALLLPGEIMRREAPAEKS